MQYLYIELNYYKRMSLGGLNHFAMTITEPLQLVLGSNGSGKSSLLGELTPLPALHGDFHKGGSKVIKLLHHAKTYVLKSSFITGQTHSFTEDGDELNKGGTVTVQRDLVKQYFGITTDIHELLLGRECFDQMNTSRRKEWFLRLCDTNYDYAIKVYNVLREKHRDASGALRVAKKRLVSESEKLIDSAEEARLRSETQALHTQLAHLLEYRKPVEKDPEVLRLQQDQLDATMLKQASALKALQAQQSIPASILDTLSAEIATQDQAAIRAKTLVEQFTSVHQKNCSSIQVLQKAEQQTIEQLQSVVDTLQDQWLTLLGKSLVLFPEQTSMVSAASAFASVKITLSDVFSSLPNNQLKRFSSAALAESRESMASLVVKKNHQLERLQALRSKLSHQTEHKHNPNLQCPSCTHRFSLNYNESEHLKLTQQVQALEQDLETNTNPALVALQTFIDECVAYGQSLRQYTQCLNNWPILRPYWNYLTEQQAIHQPEKGVAYLTQIDKDLRHQLMAETIRLEWKEKNAILLSLKDVGGADLLTLQAQNAELEAAIETQTLAHQNALGARSKAQQARQRTLDIQTLCTRLSGFIQQKRNLNKDEIEAIRRIEFNALIRQLQSALAAREHTLNNLALQKKVVDAVAEQITDLEKDEECFGILVKQLSPTEGLIAEGLLGFIKNFVMQMNALIKKVWAYPLVIQTCEMVDAASVDLDYKFPMVVERKDNVVSDVSKGSTGMQEIVNLAFRLTAMNYLHLQGTPVFFDEFGHSLDVEHKSAAMMIVKALLEDHHCPQVFMISHDFIQYGALTNAEVCVLNDLNIVIPKMNKAVNAHVVRT